MTFRFRKPKKEVIKVNCLFCKKKAVPDYKEISTLTRYVSDRGKILNRAKTGLCMKHQKKLTRQIKRARHLALLPFVIKP